jgi:CheY-like chemotaxis protein
MARILIVDDEPNIRLTVRLALEQDKHVVDQAADGLEGLAKFGNGSQFDLVLLDHRMPGLDGLEVLRRMRETAPAARIVMISAFGTAELSVAAREAGATDFLRKPFTLEMLRGAVKVALEKPAIEPPTTIDPPQFSTRTLNGFRIEFRPGKGVKEGDMVYHTFIVHSPDFDTRSVTVQLPVYVIELVRCHTGMEKMPGSFRFWQAFCEEALTEHMWEHAAFPPSGILTVTEYTPDLRRWVEAVIGHPSQAKA